MLFELKPEEKIIMTLRRHWLVLTFSLIWFLPVFLIPFVLWLTASYLNIQSFFFAPFFWLFCSLWWLFAWAGLAIRTAGPFDKIREPKEDNVFILEDIPKPYEVQNTLSQIHHDYVNDHSR